MIYLKNVTYIDLRSLEFRHSNIKVTSGADWCMSFIQRVHR